MKKLMTFGLWVMLTACGARQDPAPAGTASVVPDTPASTIDYTVQSLALNWGEFTDNQQVSTLNLQGLTLNGSFDAVMGKGIALCDVTITASVWDDGVILLRIANKGLKDFIHQGVFIAPGVPAPKPGDAGYEQAVFVSDQYWGEVATNQCVRLDGSYYRVKRLDDNVSITAGQSGGNPRFLRAN